MFVPLTDACPVRFGILLDSLETLFFELRFIFLFVLVPPRSTHSRLEDA